MFQKRKKKQVLLRSYFDEVVVNVVAKADDMYNAQYLFSFFYSLPLVLSFHSSVSEVINIVREEKWKSISEGRVFQSHARLLTRVCEEGKWKTNPRSSMLTNGGL